MLANSKLYLGWNFWFSTNGLSLERLDILLIFYKLSWDLEGEYKHTFNPLHNITLEKAPHSLSYFLWRWGDAAHADNPSYIPPNTHNHWTSSPPFPYSRHLIFIAHSSFVTGRPGRRVEGEEDFTCWVFPVLTLYWAWGPWLEGLRLETERTVLHVLV